MIAKKKNYTVLATCLLCVSISVQAQTRITLGDKPKISSVAPTERSQTSTKYTEAEQNRYLSLVTSAYRKMLADSVPQADKLFKEAADLLPHHPSNAEVYFQLGQIAERNSNYQTASDYYRKATRINENLAKAYDRRGAVCLILRDYDTALRCYSSLLELKPDNAQAQFYKGYAYQQLKRTDDALKQYEKALSIDPGNVSAAGAMAVIMAGRKQYDEALAILDNLIVRKPSAASLYEVRGNMQMELGRNELALYDFNKAIELEPDNAVNYINRAILYSRKKQKALSENDLMRARELGASTEAIETALNYQKKQK